MVTQSHVRGASDPPPSGCVGAEVSRRRFHATRTGSLIAAVAASSSSSAVTAASAFLPVAARIFTFRPMLAGGRQNGRAGKRRQGFQQASSVDHREYSRFVTARIHDYIPEWRHIQPHRDVVTEKSGRPGRWCPLPDSNRHSPKRNGF